MPPTRRTILRRASAAGLLGLLAGCTDGGLGDGGDGSGDGTTGSTAPDSPTATPTSTASSQDTSDPMGEETTANESTNTGPETASDEVSTTETPTAERTETPAETQTAASTTVALSGFAFSPVRTTVEPGTTVRWVNEDGAGHDVTSAQFHDQATSWDYSESLSSGGSVSHTFESPGVYEYYCTIHGRSSMCGVILVGDASLAADLPCESGYGGDEGGGGYPVF